LWLTGTEQQGCSQECDRQSAFHDHVEWSCSGLIETIVKHNAE
jgi:hypothetical protein